MLALVWNLSAALYGYLRFYMPTNRAVDRLRTSAGSKWAIPVALAAAPIYLFAMSICATIVKNGGPGYLNLLVLLFAWNALKLAALAVVTPFRSLHIAAQRRASPGLPHLPRTASRAVTSGPGPA